jgi:hypothetical protein
MEVLAHLVRRWPMWSPAPRHSRSPTVMR